LYLADRGAAILIPESELTEERLQQTLSNLHRDRAKALAMAARSRRLGKPDATVDTVRICLEALGA
ncbi:MAG: UDP-N-acetylglucosamine--N-acetylmuramyl-(pentapeptide) pyrophosphoryl-undecaprenol N-acetylglucosamine transferase, partial [Gammaproteobacteria bacterium]|nr:UDP-N-acetylglucosamine--N-acetylmuramyl-(pentapeptide) pyrophosphoryl-undecaprenol N-acetylglucosamine transferase [Gammaproteobacteria bacterium]